MKVPSSVYTAIFVIVFSIVLESRASERRVETREVPEKPVDPQLIDKTDPAAGEKQRLIEEYSLTDIQLSGDQEPSGRFTMSGSLAPAAPAILSLRSSNTEQPLRELATAQAFLEKEKALFGLRNADEELRVKEARKGSFERTHVRYERLVHNIPLEGMEVILHFEGDGRMSSANGRLVPVSDAVYTAVEFASNNQIPLGESDFSMLISQYSGATEVRVESWEQSARTSAPHLVWKVRGFADGRANEYVVDALSGRIVDSRSLEKSSEKQKAARSGKGAGSEASANAPRALEGPPGSESVNAVISFSPVTGQGAGQVNKETTPPKGNEHPGYPATAETDQNHNLQKAVTPPSSEVREATFIQRRR